MLKPLIFQCTRCSEAGAQSDHFLLHINSRDCQRHALERERAAQPGGAGADRRVEQADLAQDGHLNAPERREREAEAEERPFKKRSARPAMNCLPFLGQREMGGFSWRRT